MTNHATDETFETLVSKGVVIVDFFGKTCIPCKMLARELEEIEDEFPFVQIVKVDVDECPTVTEKFQVDGIPDIYFYKDGKIAKHEVGAINGDEITSILSSLLY